MDEPMVPVPEPDQALPEPAERPHRKLQQAQYESLAIMHYNGLRVEQIAEALGVSEASVKYHLEGKSVGFNAVYDAYRDQIVRTQVQHNYRLTGLMEAGYEAVRDALMDKEGTVIERRLRKDTAFALFDRVIPQEQKGLVNVEINQQNVTVQTEVRQTHGMLVEKFGELLQAALGQDPKRHVREGADALPSAGSPQTVDVEFTE
jgi:AcrR family transcriptional regulator